MIGAFATDAVAAVAMMPQLGDDLLDEGELADAPLQGEVEARDDGSIETDPRHHDKAPASDLADPDRTRRTGDGDLGDTLGIARQADLAGQNIAGAERHDGERQGGIGEAV